MRLTLLFAFLLAACAGPAAPAADPVEDDPVSDEPMMDPRIDATYGLLAEALVGDWTIVSGPAETATFNDDNTFALFANDRPMGSGEWDVEEGDLFLLPASGGQMTYTIEERRVSGMTFSGADGAMVLERIRR